MLADKLKELSSTKNQRRMIKEQAQRLIDKIVATCVEKATANAEIGMKYVTVICDRPAVSGHEISEEDLIGMLVTVLEAEGLKVDTRIDAEYNTSFKKLFITLEWK